MFHSGREASLELLDRQRRTLEVEHGGAVGTHRLQILDRVYFVVGTNGRQLGYVMDVDVVSAEFAVDRVKVEVGFRSVISPRASPPAYSPGLGGRILPA